VKEGFYRALMASLKAGRGAGEGENGRRRRVDSAGEELEVGGDSDRWGWPGSEWERERRGSWAALVSWAGRSEAGGVWMGCVRKENEKKEKERWAGPRVEVRWVGFVFSFSFSNPFQTNFKSF
jgi:hypothetical protein